MLHCSPAETGPKQPKACSANSYPRDLGRNLGLGRETARPPGLKPAHPSPARSRPHDRIERPEINAPMYKNPKITAGIRTLGHFSPFSRPRALSLTFLPPRHYFLLAGVHDAAVRPFAGHALARGWARRRRTAPLWRLEGPCARFCSRPDGFAAPSHGHRRQRRPGISKRASNLVCAGVFSSIWPGLLRLGLGFLEFWGFFRSWVSGYGDFLRLEVNRQIHLLLLAARLGLARDLWV